MTVSIGKAAGIFSNGLKSCGRDWTKCSTSAAYQCETDYIKGISILGVLQIMEKQENSLSRLYEALVLSTLLNSAELWPVSVTQMKNLMQHTIDGDEVSWGFPGRTK